MDDFSGLEYDQESVSEEDVVTKTNNLLSQFNLPTQVSSISDITASLFVVLYESLFSDRLPGIVRQPVTREDEISNCQMVIDVLSADVIKDNLSHIRGIDIVEGKVQAINNLLDIFTFLYEYVIKQIESDVPTDTDDDVKSFERLEAAIEDSEMFIPRQTSQPDVWDKDSQEAWGDRRNDTKKGQKSIDKEMGPQRVDTEGRKTAVQANGNMSAAVQMNTTTPPPSPILPNASNILMGQHTLDSTGDLIREGEKLNRQFEAERSQSALKTVWDRPTKDQPGPFDFIGVRPAPTSTIAASVSAAATANLSMSSSAHPKDAFLDSALPVTNSAMRGEPYATDAAYMSRRPKQDVFDPSPENLSATEPLPSGHRRSRSPGRMRATVGAIPVHSHQRPEKPYQHRDHLIKGLSSSYEDLHQMVQQTAALTRAAIDTSPLRRHQDRADQLNITDLSRERGQVPPSEGMDLAKELNRGGLTYPGGRPFSTDEPNELDIYGKVKKQVTHFQEKASSLDAELDSQPVSSRKTPPALSQIPPNTDYVRPGSREVTRPSSRQQVDRQKVPQAEGKPKQSVRYADMVDKLGADREKVLDTKRQAEGKETEDRASARGQPLADARDIKELKERKGRLSNRLHEMGKTELASAQRRLETEDKMYQHKQDFVKKLYEEEFDDAVDEVKTLVDKDRKLMKAMEEEYRKLMLMAAEKSAKKTKPASKTKGFLVPKTKKAKTLRPRKTAQKKSTSADTPKVRERPLSLADDEDLMPVLLEEFPHLRLSEHTWHELWRKGIMQIENLTRAYEENKRRKSKAQLQLEEAAKKHEVLAGIIKKQLDHNQRMRQIKEQKRQQVVLNNKLHEKRTQSARARRYYNEYQVRSRSKMLKRQNKEEMVFRNLFKDGLAIQKERIQEVRRYAKEQRDKQAQKRQDEIDSLENFYRDQFEILVEKLLKDKDDMTCREKAHQKVLDQMKKELRSKMEKEIQDIQSQMFRDDDDVYFRQMEADRLRHELQHAKYQMKV